MNRLDGGPRVSAPGVVRRYGRSVDGPFAPRLWRVFIPYIGAPDENLSAAGNSAQAGSQCGITIPCQKKNTASPTAIVTSGRRVVADTSTAASAPTSCGLRHVSSAVPPCGETVIGTMIAVSTVTGTKPSAVRTSGGKVSRSPNRNNVVRIA